MAEPSRPPSQVPYPTDDPVLVSVILKPFRLEPALNALKPFHVDHVTVTEVKGYGRQKGHLELYRGAEYVIAFIPKVRIEFAAAASELPEIVQALQQAARTGRIGDGKIFVQKTHAVIDY
jgi:nitrogen regulatory protein P-II 2